MHLTRDEWTAEQQLPSESVPTPEIKPGSTALVWQLNGLEKDEYDTTADRMSLECAKSGEQCPVSAIAACFGVKDEKGERIFTTDDIPALAKKAAPAMDRIWEAFNRLNRTTPAALEAMAKNSEAASDGEKTTDSLPTSESPT